MKIFTKHFGSTKTSAQQQSSIKLLQTIAAVFLGILNFSTTIQVHAAVLSPNIPDHIVSSNYLLGISSPTFNANPSKHARVIGLFVPGIMSYQVVDQPKYYDGFVSDLPKVITNFQLAEQHNAIGMLAHNYLAGKDFVDVKENNIIIAMWTDGTLQKFRVTAIEEYQATDPYIVNSSFRNLDGEGEILTSAELFNRMYTTESKLVLQTCIEKDGNDSWGRLFIVAEPLDTLISAQ